MRKTKLKIATAPASEPVLLAEAKAQCRVDGSTDDTLITGLIKVARLDAEGFLNRAIITQTWDLYLDAWPGKTFIEIPLPPLQSVTSIKYTDKNGVEATMAAGDYIVDTVSEPGRVYLKWDKSWPSVDLQVVNGIVVRFVAGYGLAASVPETIKQAILLQIGHYYENREDVLVSNFQQQPLIGGAEALLWKIRQVPI